MRIVVLIKSVPDTASVLQLAEDNRSIQTTGLEYIMNPYDEFALEEAVRLKEVSDGEVVALSLGGEPVGKCIRQALAVGCDNAIWISPPDSVFLTADNIARLLASIVRELTPDIIFAGKQAIDDDAAQVPERVAELLGLPHVSAITRFSLNGMSVTVDRQVEGDKYTMETTLPALFTTEKGLNVPRYPKLMDIIKAKKKQVQELFIDDIELKDNKAKPGMETISMTLQKHKRTAMIMDREPAVQVGELMPLLRADGVL